MNYRCPVCMYPRLPYPPRAYHICPCCSTEFGNDDAEYSVEQLREMWVAGGANWFFGRPPDRWNAWVQLINAGLGAFVPHFVMSFQLQSNATVDLVPTHNIPPGNFIRDADLRPAA
jgi:hypothetical protein